MEFEEEKWRSYTSRIKRIKLRVDSLNFLQLIMETLFFVNENPDYFDSVQKKYPSKDSTSHRLYLYIFVCAQGSSRIEKEEQKNMLPIPKKNYKRKNAK